MQSSCEAEVRQLAGTAVLALRGEIDGSAGRTFAEAYDRAVATGSPTRLVLDFAAVDYINSTGIALIVSLLARARAERRQVVACGLSEHYQQIFVITRLSDFIELQPDLDAAVGGVGQPAG